MATPTPTPTPMPTGLPTTVTTPTPTPTPLPTASPTPVPAAVPQPISITGAIAAQPRNPTLGGTQAPVTPTDVQDQQAIAKINKILGVDQFGNAPGDPGYQAPDNSQNNNNQGSGDTSGMPSIWLVVAGMLFLIILIKLRMK